MRLQWPKVKSFEIDKRLVHEAWMKVQANGGAPGVDAVSIGALPRAFSAVASHPGS
jgi:hypothetical protein